jgi:hypothetical protein
MQKLVAIIGLLVVGACGDPQGSAGALTKPGAVRSEAQDDKHKAPAAIRDGGTPLEQKGATVQGGAPLEQKAAVVEGATPLEQKGVTAPLKQTPLAPAGQ